jgi:hypothetical protein
VGLARLSRSRCRKILVRVGASLIVINLTQRCALGVAVVRWGGYHSVAGALLGGNPRSDRHRLSHLLAHAIFEPPFAERSLVEVEPVLLRPNDHSRSHETHKCDDLVCGESVLVDQISTNQTACATETCLAVDRNALLFDGDHLVGHLDEPAHKCEGRTGAILEDHINVRNSHCSEIGRAVKLRVESHNETDVTLVEMGQNILEWHGKLG